MTAHHTEHPLAVTYLRAADATMLAPQRDHCRRAAEQLGAHIVAEYVDIGSSAASHRPGLDGVLARLHEPPAVHYVLVDRLDRLARRIDTALTISDIVTSNGADLVQACDGGAIAADPPYLRSLLLALAESPRPLLRSKAMDNDAVSHVIAAYDAMVRANTTASHDAARAVAEDDTGEVGWEVIETAERMGYAPTDDDVIQLQDAANTYQARLAAEVGGEPAALDDTWSPAKEMGRDPMIARGARVELVHTHDTYTRLEPGAQGTVSFVDSLGTVHVRWDDGSTLGLIPGEDEWRELP